MKYWLALKGNEVIHVTTWMNPQIMPGEKSKTKSTSCMILFILNSRIDKSDINSDIKKSVDAWGDRSVLSIDRGGGFMHIHICQNSLNFML